MKRGLVVGEVWATRKVAQLAGRTLKLIVEHPQPTDADSAELTNELAAELDRAPLVVAIDTLDARSGEEVLVAYGSGARNVLLPGPDNRHILCDAAVALIVDQDPGQSPTQKPTPKTLSKSNR